MSTEIIISRRDEKKFNRLLGVNNSKRLFDIRNELCEKNPTISHDCAKVGSYPFIPMALIRVMRHFIVIRKWIKKQNSYYIKATHNEKSSFLDAGSGLGNILASAKAAELAKHFTGIEFNKPTHEMAKNLINNKDKDFSLILDDVLTYSKYDMFDIIYYYSPLRVGLLEIHFEELVEDTASVGAIIIAKMKAGAQLHRDKRFRRVTLAVKYRRFFRSTETPSVTFYIKTKDGKREKSDKRAATW